MNAYYISGHGSGHGSGFSSHFTVPPGSTVVVMAREGELTYGSMLSKFCELPLHVIQQPNSPSNRAQLLETFGGSLAFYESGDLCPNFEYSFPACFKSSFDYKCAWVGSGVIDLKRLQTLCETRMLDHRMTLEGLNTDISNKFKNINFDLISDDYFKFTTREQIADFLERFMFQNSVLPTPQTISRIIRNNTDNPGFAKIRERVESLLKSHQSKAEQVEAVLQFFTNRMPEQLTPTQEQLCAKLPGVYYNFVCRPSDTNLFRLNTHQMTPNFITSGNYYSINPRMRRRSNVNLATNRASLLSHIGEAELHRKPAIRNWMSMRHSYHYGGRRTTGKHLRTNRGSNTRRRKR